MVKGPLPWAWGCGVWPHDFVHEFKHPILPHYPLGLISPRGPLIRGIPPLQRCILKQAKASAQGVRRCCTRTALENRPGRIWRIQDQILEALVKARRWIPISWSGAAWLRRYAPPKITLVSALIPLNGTQLATNLGSLPRASLFRHSSHPKANTMGACEPSLGERGSLLGGSTQDCTHSHT